MEVILMDKKMTSGEIAKKAGISQKTIRLYDEKGLLKPSEYSEGNYRLYDKEALLVLEKIIALKQIGFSLEEIHDNLIAEKNMNIVDSLNSQLQLMEEKKAEIERSIACIRSVLTRCEGKPDWNSVAEIARMIQEDQGADKRHFDALKHTIDDVDWYVKIYESLDIKEALKILDIGCGFAKLWRNNWHSIPEGANISAIDVHGSWADNFAEYVGEHKAELAEGTEVKMHWGDVNEEAIWGEISENGKYDMIIAHYLLTFINDIECFISKVADALSIGGMFSCNGYAVSPEHLFWKDVIDNAGLDSAFILKLISKKEAQRDQFTAMLSKYFSRVESVILDNRMRYEDSEELFARMLEHYPEQKKYIVANADKIKGCLDKMIAEQGAAIVDMEGQFWHCYK